jgi:hypothetical protein
MTISAVHWQPATLVQSQYRAPALPLFSGYFFARVLGF